MAMNLGSIEVIKSFVEYGLGVAIVPRVAVEQEVEVGRLVALRVRGLPPRSVGLIERRGKNRSPAAEVFLDMLDKRVKGLVF